MRTCSTCGQTDEHPRHSVGVVNLRSGQEPPAGKHLDCCASGGCGLCIDTLARHGGKTGQDLIDSLAAERAARTEEN